MGINVPQLQEMELWEFYACAKAFEKKQHLQDSESIVQAWRTGNFTGAAFGGKLKNLSSYLTAAALQGTPGERASGGKSAPQISKEDFDAKVKMFQKGGGFGGP